MTKPHKQLLRSYSALIDSPDYNDRLHIYDESLIDLPDVTVTLVSHICLTIWLRFSFRYVWQNRYDSLIDLFGDIATILL